VGFDLIRQDAADVMIVGGADEMHYSSVATLDLLMATSHGWNDRPSLSPRPFDARRDGLVVGEAAATLVLEEREHALARGAHILGEIHAYATNCGGHHMTQPDVGRMRTVMELALAQARRGPEEIEYVDAHATGTGVGDLAEARATWETFARAIPISSQKGHVGHTLGACGALEVIFALGTMREGFLAPTLNLETLDPELPPLDFLREVRPTRARLAMSNNFAFGGVNTSIVLSAD
jgi:3-oxoacyl-[acyl-carrier-protein] synthase II